MKAAVVQIGNSKGIRIPQVILDMCNIGEEVEIEMAECGIVLKPRSQVKNPLTAFPVLWAIK